MSRRFVLIGHPVAHSLSPAIHRAAYHVLGLDHRYELIDAADESDVKDVVESLRRGEIAGMNVTIPYKRVALALADECSAAAKRIGAANVLERTPGGRVVAHNTDVLALVEEFKRLAYLHRAVVIGSGGAALAVVVACQESRAREVGVTSRRWSDASDPSTWPKAAEFQALGAELLAWPGVPGLAKEQWEYFVEGAQLIVQASSAGMHGADPGSPVADLVPWSRLRPDTFAYDLVYSPPDTPFVVAARRAGVVAEHGLSMLVGQAAHALQIWLGIMPKREPLLAAAEQALAERGRS